MDDIIFDNIFSNNHDEEEQPDFGSSFFSRMLNQQFNNHSIEFTSDENEPAIRKYLKAMNFHNPYRAHARRT